MNKTFRPFTATLIMALAVFLFAGCGGGDEEGTAPPPKKSGTNSSTAAGAGPTEMPEDLIGQTVMATKESPEDFTQAIENNRPVVVTFYMPAPYDDSQVRSSVMTLEGQYRGQVEFLSYLYSDAQSYQNLATLLNVNASTAVIIINRQGIVQRAWTGYVDEESISQGITEALKSTSN